jgi:DNA-binding ferritin-like protein
MPLGLAEPVRREMAARLNKVLSNTRVLYQRCSKSHQLMRGLALHRLLLLTAKHAGGNA